MKIGDTYFRLYNRRSDLGERTHLVVYKITEIISDVHFFAEVIYNSRNNKKGKTNSIRNISSYTKYNYTTFEQFRKDYPEYFI